MKLEKSNKKDISKIMNIIGQAQQYFKSNNINQWQNNYPNEDTINSDIEKGESYKLVDEDEIIGTVAISFNGEPTYENIYEGKWLTNGAFGVIHRIAVESSYKGKGVASEIIKFTEEICIKNNVNSIRVDTHEENTSMQKLLNKNGFEYCGIIYLADKSKRIAFEKIIKK